MILRKFFFIACFYFVTLSIQAQNNSSLSTKQRDPASSSTPSTNKNAEHSEIDIIHGGDFLKKEQEYPGAAIFIHDGQQVQFRHNNMNVWCDFALFYKISNTLRASGHIRMQQGDTIQMTSKYIEYDGNTGKALSRGDVVLTTKKAVLTTDSLYYDRVKQEAFYDHYGTLKDPDNVLTSQEGTYYLKKKKTKFSVDVVLTNKDFVMKSQELFYYPNTKNVYFKGPTRVTGEKYVAYSEQGFYDTKGKQGYFLKNSKIDYDNRTMYGDSIYYNDTRKFSSLNNNIKVIDTLNKTVLQGHYAEIYKDKDSIIVTKRPVVAVLKEKDSLFIHSDTIMLTGKKKNRTVKLYHKVRMFGPNMSAKCDSLFSSEKKGIIKMINNPVVWYGDNQITGKKIYLKFDENAEKLDSIEVRENTFIISRDTLDKYAFNQIKGDNLFGKMEEDILKTVDIIKNCQVIYYIFNDENELVGINKTNSDAINVVFKDKKVNQISFTGNPVGDIFPEFDLPKNARRLKGFKWRGRERIRSKEDLFDEDDKNIVLPVIRGLDHVDIDAREQEYNKMLLQIEQNPKQSIPSLQTSVTDSLQMPPSNQKNKDSLVSIPKDKIKENIRPPSQQQEKIDSIPVKNKDTLRNPSSNTKDPSPPLSRKERRRLKRQQKKNKKIKTTLQDTKNTEQSTTLDPPPSQRDEVLTDDQR